MSQANSDIEEQETTNQTKSLENIDLTNPRERLISPHSIQALRILGFDFKEIQFKTISEFKNSSLENKALKNDLLIARYNHFEQRRLNFLKLAKEKRQELIRNSTINSKIDPNSSNNNESLSRSKMLPTSTTIQNDLRKLEMLRQKQIEEIEGMLQNQLSLEETRNKNNLKMQKQIEKEQKQHREKMILAQEEKKRIIIKEKERQEKMKEEAILLEKHYQARQEKEKQQLIEEMKIKEQERIENEKKKEMKKKRDEVFRNTIDDMYNYQHSKLLEKHKDLEKKEELRKSQIEVKKRELSIKSKMKSELNKKKMEFTIMSMEEKMKKHKEEFDIKQKILEESKIKYQMKREHQNIIMREFAKKKEHEINLMLKRNEDREKEKVSKYHQKQEKINKRKSEKDLELKKYLIIKQLEQQEKEARIHQTQLKSEEQQIQHKNFLINKLNKINERIDKKKEENQNEAVIKFELLSWRREDHYQNVIRNDKIQEYIKQQKLNGIYARMKKIDDINNQKLIIANEKREIQNEIKMKKETMIKKLEKLLLKGKIDKDEIYKEINILKGEKTNNSSNPQMNQTAFIKTYSNLSEIEYQENFQTENNWDNEILITDNTDYRGVSTYASID